jgi:uncharacterized protein (TIGR02001 family)
MKSMKTLALAVGLLGLSGVSQAQFSSTWTAVSDYDFRGFSQSAKDPALQGSADYAFGESGFAIGAWASTIDFDNDEDVELDLYAGYTGSINDTFSWNAGAVWYDYPLGDDTDGYAEIYAGFTAGNFGFKQWFSDDFYALGDTAQYTEFNYTQPIGEQFSLAFHAGYSWGDYWEDIGELVDFAIQANYAVGDFTIFAKFTGTDASGDEKIEDDLFNNEPRFLVGVMTTLPWGE